MLTIVIDALKNCTFKLLDLGKGKTFFIFKSINHKKNFYFGQNISDSLNNNSLCKLFAAK